MYWCMPNQLGLTKNEEYCDGLRVTVWPAHRIQRVDINNWNYGYSQLEFVDRPTRYVGGLNVNSAFHTYICTAGCSPAFLKMRLADALVFLFLYGN